MTDPIEVNLPDIGGVINPTIPAQREANARLYDVREWARDAMYAKGAKYGGGSGFGCGQADFDIEKDGHRYNVSIRPLRP